MYTIQHVRRPEKPEKETIHSGHFMVSHFEAEEQDDEDNVAIPIPEVADANTKATVPVTTSCAPQHQEEKQQQQLSIDTSLAKLFQCMSLAYRQKLTSPKWNRFRGIRLRWKDKIRLNNVIWRCWHLQFIKKENTLVCQFASPLDVDTHNKPEAVVLEGKYWKRKLAAVTAEYKRWRMFYRNNLLGHATKDPADSLNDMDLLVWDSGSSDNMNMMVDEDYMGLMSDTLFSTITNQPFVFPDSREIARAGLADFIQPSLGPLQPNLEDYMDTFDPLQELISSRLPTVPEENQTSQQQQASSWGYLDNSMSSSEAELQVPTLPSPAQMGPYQLVQIQQIPTEKQVPIQDTRQQANLAQTSYNDMMLQQPLEQYVSHQNQPPPYSSVISKNTKHIKSRGKPQNLQTVYSKSLDNIYPSYSQPQSVSGQVMVNDRICMPVQNAAQAIQQQQQQQQSVQDMSRYKLISTSQDSRQGYKFSVPATPNIKFTSPQVQHTQMMQPPYPSHSQYNASHAQKEEKTESRHRGAPRGRGRSRSNTREPLKRPPPLISAVSDTSLITPQTSILLTQLLTNSNDSINSIYNQSQTTRDLLSNQIRVKEETTGSVPILPQPPPTTLIIPAQLGQVSISTVQPSTSDPLLLNTFSNSNSPILDSSSQNIHSPTSSQGSIGSPNTESSHRDRRVGHIHAEQKRRYNIKNGFDMIHSLIPHLNQNPNAKLSKAAMLQKGAEYIRQLRAERSQLKDEMDSLRQQIETLNTSISNCQSMLPATGAPVSRPEKDGKMQEMFDDYVRTRTMDNWKFWIVSF
ncbi:hypothetical protein NQ317_012361 [Molorchus minor]|uniref:BHLH domain-containing protein n=1 Tax=Molorchus minor TaxID=1323400 RepID=A0ABQ9J0L6_9CUCU|nr:hypothetical protein NQ317_012361 [Molorchus minor]